MKLDIKLDPIIEKLKKLDPKYHYYILAGVVLLFFLVHHLLVLGPLLGSLNKMNAHIAELKQNIADVKNDMARINQNRAQLEKIRGQINEVKIKIRSRQEVPLILDDISRIASRNNVKIDQLMPLKDQKELIAKQKDVDYYALPILVQARSSYHDLGRCLAQFEADKIFYNLGEFNIITNPKDPMHHSVQLTLKAVTWEPPKVDPPKGKKAK